MDQYIIKGGNPLVGEVEIGGAKNAALAILAAAIMTDDTVRLENLPDVNDINVLLEAIGGIGAKVERVDRHTAVINGSTIGDISVDYEYIKKIRASYYLLGALLGKYKKAEVPLPGGCNIGSRPIDLHLKGFRALGATVDIKYGAIVASAPDGLHGTHIFMDTVSVGATINIMMAASMAKGNTIIENAAKELHMAIGITFLERYGDGIRNSLVLFDRFGVKQLTYAKVHTCDFDVERHLTPGEDFYVTALDTACGMVQVGAMICFDREFPESARILMLKGAELILVPNACPMEINRLSQLRGRAYENMLAIATCNYPETVPDCNGGSSVFDGVAYLPEEEHSRDTCILQAGGQEGIYLASLNLDQLRSYRQQEVHGNAYRHPKKYGLLVDRKIDQPFVRDDYRE